MSKENTGDWNTGHWNTGDWNTGHWNTGNRNTGHWNTGHWNTCHRNTGDRNTGNRNTGDLNTGHWNTGNRNTGHWNTGDRNTGHWNTGDRNTGHRNTGDRNTGDLNTGDLNTGDWNTGHRNTGFFCTNTPYATLFDEPTTLTHQQVADMIPYVELPVGCEWVPTGLMTTEEKDNNPTYHTTGGFLRLLSKSIQEAFPLAWATLNIETKQRFHSLPNFNADKFLTCTGVDVRLDKDLYPQPEPEPDFKLENGSAIEIIYQGKRYKLTPA